MGQEIEHSGFDEASFADFRQRLAEETALARHYFREGRFSDCGPIAGFELEAWLVDRNLYPAPDNQSFLARLSDPSVVPELSLFNIEVNGEPQPVAGDGLGRLERAFAEVWRRCVATAHGDVDTAVAIGSLPTLRDRDLSLAHMTPSNRYIALNRELMRARGGREVEIRIDSAEPGGAPLKSRHVDVMIEAATTSFQVHLQTALKDFVRTFNASMVLSAPLLALSANSPFLFGKPLWRETRIAVFEQAFEGRTHENDLDEIRRVTFGRGYLDDDPTVLFQENLDAYPVLLPIVSEAPVDRFSHLRLHNGAIWRWNRPLIGFDPDGRAHLRLEQRVMPAGPSTIDMFANAAFFYGVVHMLARDGNPPETRLPFQVARRNFYAAARRGLDAEISWLDGRSAPVTEVLKSLLPVAREGLARQGVSADTAERCLDVVRLRLDTGQNGAAWQVAHFRRHRDVFKLTADYLEHQRSGAPVHEWTVQGLT